ncbi:hypothetical protein NDU88_006490 [Pleurodeles waltl]|uniref:Uncharacterized protein n=1 Tax=Pleurodeles waltl TaxID=8319 RepID=A0AAV7SPW9_PLEWA|nr:hypothetical protein NDU88_006490 [Pleurodeles waltl]
MRTAPHVVLQGLWGENAAFDPAPEVRPPLFLLLPRAHCPGRGKDPRGTGAQPGDSRRKGGGAHHSKQGAARFFGVRSCNRLATRSSALLPARREGAVPDVVSSIPFYDHVLEPMADTLQVSPTAVASVLLPRRGTVGPLLVHQSLTGTPLLTPPRDKQKNRIGAARQDTPVVVAEESKAHSFRPLCVVKYVPSCGWSTVQPYAMQLQEHCSALQSAASGALFSPVQCIFRSTVRPCTVQLQEHCSALRNASSGALFSPTQCSFSPTQYSFRSTVQPYTMQLQPYAMHLQEHCSALHNAASALRNTASGALFSPTQCSFRSTVQPYAMQLQPYAIELQEHCSALRNAALGALFSPTQCSFRSTVQPYAMHLQEHC